MVDVAMGEQLEHWFEFILFDKISELFFFVFLVARSIDDGTFAGIVIKYICIYLERIKGELSDMHLCFIVKYV